MLNFIKKKASEINKIGFPIRISADLLKKTIENREINDIEDLMVRFVDDTLVIEGKSKKMLIKIPFKIILRPIYNNDLKIYFSVVKISPIDAEWLKSKILQRPPMLKYDNSNLELDIDALDVIKNIPVGKIRSIKIENQCLIARVGI